MVACAKSSSTVAGLNELVMSGMDARGQKLSSSTKWINISQQHKYTAKYSVFTIYQNDIIQTSFFRMRERSFLCNPLFN